MHEREDANRTWVAGSRDEVESVVTSKLDVQRNGAVGFIDWLDAFIRHSFVEWIREDHPPVFIESESHAR